MSKKATNNTNENNLNNIAGTLKTENYLISLQNENTYLNAEIKKLNDIVNKLKSQLTNFETEKKNLISNTTKKENDLKEVKSQFNSHFSAQSDIFNTSPSTISVKKANPLSFTTISSRSVNLFIQR